jgi:hypothetical protein
MRSIRGTFDRFCRRNESIEPLESSTKSLNPAITGRSFFFEVTLDHEPLAV